MATFSLPSAESDVRIQPSPESDGLGSVVLLHNARWFTHVRWVVVAVFLAFGIASTVGRGLLRAIGMGDPLYWPYAFAAILTAANVVFCVWLRRPRADHERSLVESNIWCQIVLDLLVVTVLVHLVGSTSTFIAFTYLFHITLACIFFPPRVSLLVTLLASGLYGGCVMLELAGVLPPSSIFIDPPMPHGTAPWLQSIHAASAVFVWLIVWYLVSTLSKSVRERDQQLDRANRELMAADQEKNLQVLRVTHDLKAPFAGIECSIQILKRSHWDEIPETVRQIVRKIDARSAALRARIGDILTLGSLRSARAGERVDEPVNLHGLLDAVLQDVQGLLADRQVSVDLAACEVGIFSDPRQLKILFANLVSNAILYSPAGGTVEVGIEEDATRVCVRVADHGIGIGDKALPRIFEDFFRAPEAAAFNPNSTGLGLAIVRQVALNLRLTIEVDSEQGKGTTFRVLVPKNNVRREE